MSPYCAFHLLLEKILKYVLVKINIFNMFLPFVHWGQLKTQIKTVDYVDFGDKGI